jgi:hydroxymethylbilane synthase
MNPSLELRYVWIESEGDRHTDRSLADVGEGKGLFVRAVEQALREERADLAVHSLKDMPADLTPGLAIAATPRREDVRDCLIARSHGSPIMRLLDLPREAVVGTSGPRRAAQVSRLRPDVTIRLIRGNVETRLAKVLGTPTDDGGSSAALHPPAHYDATLLAMAGLRRAALDRYAIAPLSVDEMLPAAGQGALAIQCRGDDHVSLTRCLPLNDPVTAAAVHAEREVVRGLAGDCHSPIAVYAEPISLDRFRLRARVLSPDGRVCLDTDAAATTRGLAKLAREMVKNLQARGADTVMRAPAADVPHATDAPVPVR